MGGRARGQPNVVTRSVREGIIAGLNAAGGVGGVADYVTKVALQDQSDSYPISPARYRAKAVKYAIESAGLLGDTEKKSH